MDDATLYDKVKNLWGNKLKPLSTSLVDAINLPHDTKYFLVNVGLPVKNKVLYVSFYDKNISQISHKTKNYVVVGDDYGTSICIEETTGEIYSIDQTGEYRTRFINSNIAYFLVFLKIYSNTLSKKPRRSDKQSEILAQSIETDYMILDSKALSHENNWWAVILEQVRDGLL